MASVTPKRQSVAARQLVVRARQGDQNAMAMIARVAEVAKQPNPPLRAVIAHRLIQDYIKKNPADPDAIFGADPPKAVSFPKEEVANLRNPVTFPDAFRRMQGVVNGVLVACLVLAEGPMLSLDVLSHYGNYIRSGNVDTAEAIATVDHARRIQSIRHPQTPLWVLSPEVSWELEG